MTLVNIRMELTDWTRLVADPWDSVADLQKAMRDAVKPEALSNFKRPIGRPIKGGDQHPELSIEEMTEAHSYLFDTHAINRNDMWRNPANERPVSFSADQTGMAADEIRLSNGVIAVLNRDLEGIPPQPRY